MGSLCTYGVNAHLAHSSRVTATYLGIILLCKVAASRWSAHDAPNLLRSRHTDLPQPSIVRSVAGPSETLQNLGNALNAINPFQAISVTRYSVAAHVLGKLHLEMLGNTGSPKSVSVHDLVLKSEYGAMPFSLVMILCVNIAAQLVIFMLIT